MDAIEIHTRIKKGDVLASFNKKNFFSRGVAHVTSSAYSHVFLYIGDGKILESNAKGVVVRDYNYYMNADKYNLLLLRPFRVEAMADKFVKAAMKYRGVKYGFLQVFIIWLKYTLRMQNDMRYQVDAPGMICSELIATALQDIGYYPFEDNFPSHITPAHLVESLTHVV